jgi:putative redox protein
MKSSGRASSHRGVTLSRVRKARYVARNHRGGELEVGEAEDGTFTPVELLLVAIAGCMAIDVDYITAKRAEADRLDVRAGGRKVRDDLGNRMVDLLLEIEATFPEGEAGDAARAVLADAVDKSRDRLCTVSRTVTVGSPVATSVAGPVAGA